MLVERPWLEALKQELDIRAEASGPPFEKALTAAWTRSFGEMFSMLNFIAQRRRPVAADYEEEKVDA